MINCSVKCWEGVLPYLPHVGERKQADEGNIVLLGTGPKLGVLLKYHASKYVAFHIRHAADSLQKV